MDCECCLVKFTFRFVFHLFRASSKARKINKETEFIQVLSENLSATSASILKNQNMDFLEDEDEYVMHVYICI